MVFVLDTQKKPLMPCTPRRARLLLTRRRAAVHRLSPFTIRLKDRTVGESTLQPVGLKIDPRSKTTGLGLARGEETQEGEIHHALPLAELVHRGEEVRERLRKRAGYRRRRRAANLRYRAPRFLNRRRPAGWLPPSLRSRIGNVLTFARRSHHWAPITRIDVERATFDTHLLHDPEVSGIQYQRGQLAGWEVRSYVLEKFGYRCAYCVTPVKGYHLSGEQSPASSGNGSMLNEIGRASCRERV